jgi:hypothetical protein
MLSDWTCGFVVFWSSLPLINWFLLKSAELRVAVLSRKMSYVVHPSGKSRRARKNEEQLGGKAKIKAKNREVPEERELGPRKVRPLFCHFFPR